MEDGAEAFETISNLIINYLGKYLKDHSGVPTSSRALIAERKKEWRHVFSLALIEGD